MTGQDIQSAKRVVWDCWQLLDSEPGAPDETLDRFFDDNIVWHGPGPIGNVEGLAELKRLFFGPLWTAMPDLRRVPYLFLGGHYEDGCWVASCGEYRGTFKGPWLGIPATDESVSIRFGEFCRVVDNKIDIVFTLLDIVDLMSQAGYDVLPPSNGEDIPIPGPSSGRGVLLDSQDDCLSRQSLDTLESMLFKGMDYRTAHAGGSMEGYWVDDMVWYGPKGVGSAHGLADFKTNIQGPILAAHPDRIGGFHLARVAEGECAAMCGLETLQGTHTGHFLGIPETGRRVKWRILDFYTLKDGLLFENWNIIDIVDVCSQLGVDLFERLSNQR